MVVQQKLKLVLLMTDKQMTKYFANFSPELRIDLTMLPLTGDTNCDVIFYLGDLSDVPVLPAGPVLQVTRAGVGLPVGATHLADKCYQIYHKEFTFRYGK